MGADPHGGSPGAAEHWMARAVDQGRDEGGEPVAERDEVRGGGGRAGREPVEAVVVPGTGGLEPEHEIVPAWVLITIVAGLAVMAGSIIALALLSIATIIWTIVTADRTPPPPRRPRRPRSPA
jgi:hypothetical protein